MRDREKPGRVIDFDRVSWANWVLGTSKKKDDANLFRKHGIADCQKGNLGVGKEWTGARDDGWSGERLW